MENAGGYAAAPARHRGSSAGATTRCRHSRGLVKPPGRFVDRVEWLVVPDAVGADDLARLIVENHDRAVDIDGENGVRHPEIEILDDDDPEILRIPAEIFEGEVLAD